MRTLGLAILALTALGSPWQLSAQPGREGPNARFEASGLEPGSAFPVADIYDAEGDPYNTRSLKGFYTVVVNGCLT